MPHESVELTLDGVLSLLQTELGDAQEALGRDDFDTALNGYVAALGLALQLGPAPSEQVLRIILDAAQTLARRGEADDLSTLGPALVDLVEQIHAAGVLPATPAMEAWAAVTTELGALIGQIGLALTVPAARRSGMFDSARARAAVLDDATGSLFCLTAWLDGLLRG